MTVCYMFSFGGRYTNDITVRSRLDTFIYLLGLIRLAGIPPTIGFWLKVIIVTILLAKINLFFISFRFLIISIFILTAYINIGAKYMVATEKHKLLFVKPKTPRLSAWFFILILPIRCLGLAGPTLLT